jgi:hypothetical protein|tara:strand:- start:4100 stop:4255 length:156 start_codon:yes stop_codon:yes gene_type:complete
MEIPAKCLERIRAFLLAGLTGNIQLDVKDGKILAWKITEYERALTTMEGRG